MLTILYRETEEEIVEQQSLADTNDETTASDKHEEENDQRIITSILTDGHYDISSEDRSILGSIVTQ